MATLDPRRRSLARVLARAAAVAAVTGQLDTGELYLLMLIAAEPPDTVPHAEIVRLGLLRPWGGLRRRGLARTESGIIRLTHYGLDLVHGIIAATQPKKPEPA